MTYKILFVDDEPSIFEIIRRKIKREDFQMFFAESAEAALNIMEEEEIAVLVTDLRMPGVNGITLLENAREKYPNTVRIVMSYIRDINTIFVSIGKGQVYKYISKPIMYEEELIPALDSAVEKYTLQIEKTKDFEELYKINEEMEKEKEMCFIDLSKNKQYKDSISRLLLRYSKEIAKLTEDMNRYLKNPYPNYFEKSNLLGETKKVSEFTDSILRHLNNGEKNGEN